MQNQTNPQNAQASPQNTPQAPKPKLTIRYFAKTAMEQLKGKIPIILLVLALLALPAAAVNAYSSANMLSSVSQLLNRYDFSSPEDMQGFMLALQDAQSISSFADIALWFISQLLSCAVITAAAVFVYEALNKETPFDEVKARMPVTLLKRSGWVFLISIFASFLMSMLSTYITYLALLFAMFIRGTAGIIFSSVVFLIVLWLATAFINLFIINMRTAVAVNRARLLFSVTYVSTILKGRYKKSMPVYLAALACRFLITALLTAAAYFILPLEGGPGYITLFVYFLLSLIIDGLFSAFYTVNFFRLEITGQKQLIKLQAAIMKKYEEALRQSGQMPPSGLFTPSARQQRPDDQQQPDGQASEEGAQGNGGGSNGNPSQEQNPSPEKDSQEQNQASPENPNDKADNA